MNRKRAPLFLNDAVLLLDGGIINAPVAFGAAADGERRLVHEAMLAGEAIEEDEFWSEETHVGKRW